MIKLITSTAEFKNWRENVTEEIGLVPTMGNLHAGHLSLVQEAAKNFSTVVVTIFVNPKQFGPNEDFARYPRTLEDDLELLRNIDSNVVVFAPKTPNEIYPDSYATEISVPDLSRILCGKTRPTHFAGVTTVVYQLFMLTRPSCAYFGLKDYQQFKIIERMTLDLHLPLKLQGMPIIRDHDGLALSSRNRYLKADEREDALKLYKTLIMAKEIVISKGCDALSDFFNSQLKITGWDYLEARNATTLQEISPGDNLILLAGARFVGSTRLIDNLVVETDAR